MRFYITLSKWNAVFPYWFSENNGWSVVSGSTASTINLSTTMTGDPTGYELVFLSGNAAPYGSSVASYTTSGSYVDSVTLVESLPNAPSPGDRFVFVDPTGTTKYRPVAVPTKMQVVSLQATSTIEKGFDSATIKVVPNSLYSVNLDTFIGSNVTVYGPYGGLVWCGLCTDASYVDNRRDRVELSATGYMNTFDFYHYEVFWDGVATTTTPAVLKGIISTNPYIYGTPAQIDPDGSLDAAQSAVGGIGPLKFDEESPTALEAIKKVLSMGRLPLEATEMFLNFWGPYGPEVVTFSRNRYLAPKWYVNKGSIRKSDLARVGMSFGVSGNETKGYVEHTVDGEKMRTAAVYVIWDYIETGRKEKIYTESEISKEFAEYLLNTALPRNTLTFIGGDMELGPYLRMNAGGSDRIGTWLIRPGDTIDVADVYGKQDPAGGVFTVGKVTFTYPAMTTEVSAYTPRSLKDIVEQYLEV